MFYSPHPPFIFQAEIGELIDHVYASAQLEPECAVIALVYLERFLQRCGSAVEEQRHDFADWDEKLQEQKREPDQQWVFCSRISQSMSLLWHEKR